MINQFNSSSEKYNFQCKISSNVSENSSNNSIAALEKNFDLINNHGAFCACVECRPIGNDHENFLSDMPEDPVDIISDFSRMGLIKNEAYEIADAISTAEMRDLLFYKNASNGDPYKERLLRE